MTNKTRKRIGTLIVGEGVERRQEYEVAAWYKIHLLTPGEYPIYETPRRDAGDYYTGTAEIPSVIVKANLTSMFGGVSYGPDTAGQRTIGKADFFIERIWSPDTSREPFPENIVYTYKLMHCRPYLTVHVGNETLFVE